MSARLDELIVSTRDLDARFARAWDSGRAARVREGALRRRDVGVRRERTLRRGLAVAGGAAVLVLALLRAASSAPASAPTTATTTLPSTTEIFASRTFSDAGYACD